MALYHQHIVRLGGAVLTAAILGACGGEAPPASSLAPDKTPLAHVPTPPVTAPPDLGPDLRSVLGHVPKDPLGVIPPADENLIADAVRRFYEARRYEEAWYVDGRPRLEAYQAVERLAAAEEVGLRAADYRPERLHRYLEEARDGFDLDREEDRRRMAAIDIELSHALAVYALHRLRGRIHPERVNDAWYIEPRQRDLAAVLERAVDEDVAAAMEPLDPDHRGFDELLDALARYREIVAEGGWPRLPEGAVLEPGDEAPVSRLRPLLMRLAAEGYIEAVPDLRSPATADGEPTAIYDERIATVVRLFQRRHGLEQDGKLGPNTLAALNVPATERVEQIELNLERLRWLPREPGVLHIEVNLPAYRLHVVREGRRMMTMRVVIGKDDWITPVFSDTLETIVVNPYWYVPDTIAVADVLPKARRDRSELAQYEFLSKDDGAAIDPSLVDPFDFDGEAPPYRLRQRPGSANPLGRLKFLFPNQHSIYLHDTPADSLFEREDRALSHGCVRIERPVDLAKLLLRGHPQWEPARLDEALASSERVVIDMHRAVPVVMLYWTVDATMEELPAFYGDPYGFDEQLAEELAELPGGAAPVPQGG